MRARACVGTNGRARTRVRQSGEQIAPRRSVRARTLLRRRWETRVSRRRHLSRVCVCVCVRSCIHCARALDESVWCCVLVVGNECG